jgi:ribonuclease-3
MVLASPDALVDTMANRPASVPSTSRTSAHGRSVDDDVAHEADRLLRAEGVLNYRFEDQRHLLSALTHSSWKNEHRTEVAHNEVLEFVGDAVLSLVVVDDLVRTTPSTTEGALTERRAAHVSAEALAVAAVRTGLDGLLRTGKSLALNRPQNVIADVVEAVIGAVWLDAGSHGLAACRALVLHLLGPPPTAVVEGEMHAKRVLQERLERLLGKAPDYRVVRGDGPNHAPTYRAEVCFNTVVLGAGEGSNKRLATEAAADAAVKALIDVDDQALRERLQ